MAQLEALQLTLLDREKREIALRDFDNKTIDYDQRFGTNLRKQGQVHRFRTVPEKRASAADSGGALMASPVLSEIDRIKRQEQAVTWDRNEKLLAERVALEVEVARRCAPDFTRKPDATAVR